MKDNILLAEREKIFDQYRDVSKKCDILNRNIADLRMAAGKMQDEYNRASKEKAYLDALIKLMIYHDCDPVEAKLKYDEELAAQCEGAMGESDTKSQASMPISRRW